MPRTLLSLLAFFWCCGATSAQEAPIPAEPALYSLAVQDAPVENGKKLNMSFRELTRETEQSLVEVTRTSGGSVSTSLFIVRGMCGLMRARGEESFVSEPVPKQSAQYRVTFPKVTEATEPHGRKQLAFSVAQCSLLGF